MEIKLTGNSFANETDKRTNHLLSKMSPIVIQNTLSISHFLCFLSVIMKSLIQLSDLTFKNAFFEHT